MTKPLADRLKRSMSNPPISGAHVRIARPTDDIEALRNFYCNGLGFTVLAEFGPHEGFDGLIVGLEPEGYHLEFTTKEGHKAGRAPTEDNLLVFYLPVQSNWRKAVENMEKAGCKAVKAFNPYWDRVGKTFEDPDGYRIVLQHADWNNADVAGRWRESRG